jgi:hypothetical protein
MYDSLSFFLSLVRATKLVDVRFFRFYATASTEDPDRQQAKGKKKI